MRAGATPESTALSRWSGRGVVLNSLALPCGVAVVIMCGVLHLSRSVLAVLCVDLSRLYCFKMDARPRVTRVLCQVLNQQSGAPVRRHPGQKTPGSGGMAVSTVATQLLLTSGSDCTVRLWCGGRSEAALTMQGVRCGKATAGDAAASAGSLSSRDARQACARNAGCRPSCTERVLWCGIATPEHGYSHVFAAWLSLHVRFLQRCT